ncbi:hypothetical protein B0T10DRAFT_497783 [Thelonectria olida]|uniref:Uncharacterized protein n=1 Tax=Thelonectria olida TaxID=1576542 RepID=A0A9P8VT45_9HYPO|nr:hypothetical protein B0T10DRAFT_497783 [Thelonectria olida]
MGELEITETAITKLTINDVDSDDDDRVEIPTDSDSDFDETTISIGLSKTGERGSGYHTRNDPSAPYQRATVTERRGIIEVRCKSREVIHGGLSPDSEDNATLLVYDLHLDTTKRSRRILSATLEFEFSSSVPGTPAPEVQAIAPTGRVAVLSSTQEESLTRGTEVKASAGQFVDLGASAKWEKTVNRTTSDQARVKGRIFSDDYGKGVGASWVLEENSSIKSGVPSFLRCAMLLNRKFDEENFQCKVKIKAEAGWKSEMGKLFGSTPQDDPVLFDPTLKPTNKLRKEYDLENLGGLDLDDFVEIVFDKSLRKKDAA